MTFSARASLIKVEKEPTVCAVAAGGGYLVYLDIFFLSTVVLYVFFSPSL